MTWLTEVLPPAEDEPMGGADGWFARVAGFLRETASTAPERFEEIMGVGPTVRTALVNWLSDPATAGIFDDLIEAGIEPERPPKRAPGAAAATGPLTGKTLVVTGTLAIADGTSFATASSGMVWLLAVFT